MAGVAGRSTESLGVMQGLRQAAVCLALIAAAISVRAVELGPRQITTPSGTRYDIVATEFISTSTQSAILVRFKVDGFDDLPKLRRAAEEIYPLYIAEADRLKLNIIAVLAHRPVGPDLLKAGINYGFVWDRQPDNTWKFYDSPKQK